MNQLVVSFSPLLFPHYVVDNCIVVIIDAIRMSATITTALANGAKEIVTLANAKETLSYKDKGYLIAGERNAIKLEGFDLGNSPFEFSKERVGGQNIAISTTNGTQVINLVQENARQTLKVEQLVVGTFLNVSSLANYLVEQDKNVLIQCSGWKNTVSTEDILFAGLLSDKLLSTKQFYRWQDSVFLAQQIHLQSKGDYFNYLMKASPRFCKKRDILEEDIRYCLQTDKFELIPIMKEGRILDSGFRKA